MVIGFGYFGVMNLRSFFQQGKLVTAKQSRHDAAGRCSMEEVLFDLPMLQCAWLH